MTEITTAPGDSLAAEGTPFRRIRMASEMWDKFAEAVAEAEPELDRSKVVREFIRWYTGDTDDLPRRPRAKGKKR